jgi:hypothetical protein
MSGSPVQAIYDPFSDNPSVPVYVAPSPSSAPRAAPADSPPSPAAVDTGDLVTPLIRRAGDGNTSVAR